MRINLEIFPNDILIDILTDWLNIADVVRLDSACCMRTKRKHLLSILQDNNFFFAEDLISPQYMTWLQHRKIRSKYLSFSDPHEVFRYLGAFNDLFGHHASATSVLSQVSSLGIQGVGEKDATRLCESLMQSSRLTSLGLRGCTSSIAAARIVSCLPSSSLLKLDLYDFHDYLNVEFSQYPNVASALMHVLDLDLSFSNFDSHGDWIVDPVLFPQLQTLRLNQCFPASEHFLLKVIQCYGPQLKRFEANLCEGMTDNVLNSLLNQCVRLKHLEIAGSSLSSVAVRGMGSCPFQLQALNLASNWALPFDVLREIIGRIAEGEDEFSYLNVSRCYGTDDALLIFLAENVTGLTNLDVSYCFKVSDAGILSLALCQPSLKVLNVSYCPKLTDFAVEMLISHNAYLFELQLQSCLEITDRALICLAENCQSLRVLNVSGCVQITDVGLWGLAAGATKTTLNHFEISDNSYITMETLEQLVLHCHALHRLNAIHCANISLEALTSLEEKYGFRLELLEMRGYSQLVRAFESSVEGMDT